MKTLALLRLQVGGNLPTVPSGARAICRFGDQVVAIGSPADAAGLRAGDVITALGDRRISSPEDLSGAVRAHRPGDRVELRWRRGPQERSAPVTLSQASR